MPYLFLPLLEFLDPHVFKLMLPPVLLLVVSIARFHMQHDTAARTHLHGDCDMSFICRYIVVLCYAGCVCFAQMRLVV
jgi:hypothetical protein